MQFRFLILSISLIPFSLVAMDSDADNSDKNKRKLSFSSDWYENTSLHVYAHNNISEMIQNLPQLPCNPVEIIVKMGTLQIIESSNIDTTKDSCNDVES